MSESAAESSTSYRDNYERHKERLLRLVQDIINELDAFQKWGAIEDDAVNVARDYSNPIHDKVKEITEFMFEKRKATRVLEYSPDILLYPESDDDSVWYESSSATSSEGEVDERVSASFSWKGKEREVYYPENMADREIPSALSKGKGKEPELLCNVPSTMPTGESSSRSSIDEIEHAKADLWKHSVDQAHKMFEFYGRLGSTEEGKHFLNEVTWGMHVAAVEIQRLIGFIRPSVNNVPTSDNITTVVHTRTSEPRDMPPQNKGEVKILPEADPGERKLTPNKIIIPGGRISTQLPPRAMRKSKKLLDSLEFASDLGDELEDEVKEKEEPRRVETRLPRETRTRYNLRSPAVKKTAEGSSRTTDKPGKDERKKTKKKEHISSSKPADRKRQFEEDEDRDREEGSSVRNKKRRREDEAEEKEIKKENSDRAMSLNKRRKGGDESANKGAKARKKIKRS
ncbi:hypothetical protein Agabi119p4_10457 [Agaricus bisporus var. burnettii]|uniref:Uncharacterized protein n=1 Tax=Agaricus bisporus var. burnettii TaxID=192524 RepID=A0A8H7EW99_AGABI|nr:hypothetical protein Agabi119p4_10457 [Agaricus bisporus var. burnettii]